MNNNIKKVPRFIIAGTQSGVGKTTIITGILGAFKKKNIKIQPFKIGPDYIDTGFHEKACNKKSYNLDTWLLPKDEMRNFFLSMSNEDEISIIEGVMGLYDGGKNGISSTADIAKILKTPIILIVDCKSMGQSAAAIVKGFIEYDNQIEIAGVILNRLGTENHYAIIKESLDRMNVPVLGAVFRNDALLTPERHLGLTPVEEISNSRFVDQSAIIMEESIDLDSLIKIANKACPLEYEKFEKKEEHFSNVKIGVAKDAAFSFYYPASINVLEDLGAEIIEFSPIKDETLPSVDGLIFGGGFPESFLKELSANNSMKKAINKASKDGMPIYAECGGYMYLAEQIIDFDGNKYPMCNVVPATAILEKKLQRVGYVTGELVEDTVLGLSGTILRGHEFHFSKMIPNVENYTWAMNLNSLRRGSLGYDGFVNRNVLASYLHLHFAGNIEVAKTFVKKCKEYSNKK